MKIEIDTSGFDRILKEHPQKVDRWLAGVAEDMRTQIVMSFNTSPPGREYSRGTVTHVASQPGYPPNIDTGALAASIRVRRVGEFKYEIADGVEHGIHQEDGTEEIEPRPFFGPVFAERRKTIESDAKRDLTLD